MSCGFGYYRVICLMLFDLDSTLSEIRITHSKGQLEILTRLQFTNNETEAQGFWKKVK